MHHGQLDLHDALRAPHESESSPLLHFAGSIGGMAGSGHLAGTTGGFAGTTGGFADSLVNGTPTADLDTESDGEAVYDSGDSSDDSKGESKPAVAVRDFNSFHRWHCRRKGLRTSSYRFLYDELKRRLELRIRHMGMATKDYRRYAREIERQGQDRENGEWQLLDQVYTVDISRFFRDGALWQYCLSVLWRPLVERAQADDEAVRVWVMGGANGEEVYSLAAAWMLGLEHLKGQLPELHITVMEADPACVQRAKLGKYACKHGDKYDKAQTRQQECKRSTPAWWACVKDAETFREVPDGWMDRIFSSTNSGLVVLPKFQSSITWRCERWQECASADWQAEVASKPFDFVMARHGPFLYPTMPQQRELLQVIRHCLKDEGYLVIGKHESLPKPLDDEWQALQLDCQNARLSDLAPALWSVDSGSTKGNKNNEKSLSARLGNPSGMVLQKKTTG